MASPARSTALSDIEAAFQVLYRDPARAEQHLHHITGDERIRSHRTLLAVCWFGIAKAQLMRAHLNEGLASARKSCLLYCDLGDHAGEAGALVLLGTIETQLHLLPEAREHLVEALRLAHRYALHEVESFACSRLARLYCRTGRYARVLPLLQRSRRYAQRSRSVEAFAHALMELGTFHFELGDIAKAHWYFDWCREIAGGHGLRWLHAQCLTNLAAACIRRDDYRQGLVYARHALRLAEGIGNPVFIVFILARMGFALVKCGRVREGIRAVLRAHDITERLASPHTTGALLVYVGEIYILLGEQERALECCMHALEHYRAVRYHVGEISVMYRIGRMYTQRDMPAIALRYHFAALRQAQKLGVRGTERAHILGIATAYAAVRDDRAAAQHYRTCLTYPTEAGTQEFRLSALQGLAELAGRNGNHDECIKHLGEALVVAEQQGLPFQQVRTLQLLAQAYRASGEGSAAAEVEAACRATSARFFDASDRQWAHGALLSVERGLLMNSCGGFKLGRNDLAALEHVLERQRQAGNHTADDVASDAEAPPHFVEERNPPHQGRYRVTAFGSLRLWVDGVEVTGTAWRRRRVRDLFALLLVRYRRPVTIDEIIELLWAGSTAGDTELSVMNAIGHLRRVLEPNRTAHARSHVLPGNNRTYLLDLGNDVSIDLLDFREVIARARTSCNAEERHDLYYHAVMLHQDDLLKENCYADWAASERELSKDALLEALEFLACDALARCAFEEAVSTTRRLLALDTTHESGYRMLAQALRGLGRVQEIRSLHEQCRTAFQREYGIEIPSHLADAFYGHS